MLAPMYYKTGFVSHTGLIRKENQDSFLAAPKRGLFIIADGMGGHACGAQASKLAIQIISRYIKQGSSLRQGIQHAHFSILQAAHASGEVMGSTVIALQLKDERYEIAWVGDSRAYLWDGKELAQLTKDHSYVQQLADLGLISQGAVRTHPQRHIITQALGSADLPEVLIESVHGCLHPGEQILLCSDGLNNELTDKEIKKILSRDKDEQKTVELLLKCALQKTGRDNITIILISAPGRKPSKPETSFLRHLFKRFLDRLGSRTRRVRMAGGGGTS